MKNKDETRKENSSHKPPQLIIYFFNGPSTHHTQLYIEPKQIFPKPPQTQHVIPLNCFMVRAQRYHLHHTTISSTSTSHTPKNLVFLYPYRNHELPDSCLHLISSWTNLHLDSSFKEFPTKFRSSSTSLASDTNLNVKTLFLQLHQLLHR